MSEIIEQSAFGITVNPVPLLALPTPGRIRLFDVNRSYVINYSFGEDLVANWVAKSAGEDPAARWKVLIDLLSSPHTPANLL